MTSIVFSCQKPINGIITALQQIILEIYMFHKKYMGIFIQTFPVSLTFPMKVAKLNSQPVIMTSNKYYGESTSSMLRSSTWVLYARVPVPNWWWWLPLWEKGKLMDGCVNPFSAHRLYTLLMKRDYLFMLLWYTELSSFYAWMKCQVIMKINWENETIHEACFSRTYKSVTVAICKIILHKLLPCVSVIEKLIRVFTLHVFFVKQWHLFVSVEIVEKWDK